MTICASSCPIASTLTGPGLGAWPPYLFFQGCVAQSADRSPRRYLVTAPTLSEAGPRGREQVLKGNGTSLDLVWFGGKTRRPAAVTGRHTDREKTPVSTIPSTAVAVLPFGSVTRCGVGGLRNAALGPT